MQKETNREIPWEKVVAKTEDISGIPKKQIDEVASQLTLGVEALIKENPPKRDGDIVSIVTPLSTLNFERFPAANVKNSDGKVVLRPACIGGNSTIPRHFVNKANIGLVDTVFEEPEKKKTKSA
jgi:ankyrin repeat protein